MSDLVRRLRECEGGKLHSTRTPNILRHEAADKIERLERELAKSQQHAIAGWDMYSHWSNRYLGCAKERDDAERQLTAEKALADDLYENKDGSWKAYRKARGL